MTEETEKPTDNARAVPVAGERLAEARRAREISIHDVAKELHLDEPKVRALEQNEFDRLGAPVFAKGYLRKYAELVGVSSDDVLADYYRLDRSGTEMPVLGVRHKPPRDIALGPWLFAILIAAIVAGGAWLWLSGTLDVVFMDRGPAELAPFEPQPATTPDTSGDALETGGPPDAPSAAPGSAPPAAAPARADAATPAEDTGGEPEATVAGQTPPAGPRVELTVSFSGDCWTEVSDGSGKRLYFALGTAGETASVTGAPPLHVLLGNSDNADVRVGGESVPIPRSARRGKTARLTIGDH